MTTGPPPQPGRPQTIQPRPTPFSWAYGDLRDERQQLIGKVLRLDTVTGPVFLFFDPQELGRYAADTEEALADLRGGLVVATTLPAKPPPGRGNGQRV